MTVTAASRFRSVDEQAGRREDAGAARDQQRRHLGVARERVRVHRPRAAEADEHEVARVVAALHRDQVQRVHHRGVRDLDDAVRRLDDVDRPSGFAQRSSIARARALDVEADLAAEEVVGVEPAEHDVGVGHGRLGAAAPVADRPGIGARALRPDAQQRRPSRPTRSSRRPRRSRPGRRPASGPGSPRATGRRRRPRRGRRPSSPWSPTAARPGSGRPSRSCRPCRTRGRRAGRSCSPR